MELSLESVQAFAEKHIAPAGLDLAIGVLLFFVGRYAARWMIRGFTQVMERSGMDVSLRKFLADLLYAILLVAVVTAALDRIGIRTTAVVAVLGAAGLAVGLALQGSLSNFAAGVMIIVLHHYKVGDVVVIGKYTGRIEAIKVFHTVLITADNREVTIPNGQIISQPIENMTVLGLRRDDILVTVAHGTDLRDVKRALEEVVAADVRVSLSPAPTIELFEVGTEVLKINLRPWTQVENYGSVAVDTVERVRAAFAGKGYKFTAALSA